MIGRLSALLVVILALASTAAACKPVDEAESGSAQVISENYSADRQLDLLVSSPSLDAPVKTVRLLLPRDWSPNADRTWPVLWLLHGGFDDHTSWTNNTDIAALVEDRDLIVAMPETSWCSGYSDWRNDGNGGPPKWEQYVTKELPQLLHDKYHANSRAVIAGNSMGGFGALKLAASNAGKYQAVASFSGAPDPLHEGTGGGQSAADVDIPGLACGTDWTSVWGDPARPAEREIWERNSPYHRAADLASIPLYVAAGDDDALEQAVRAECVAFADRMRALGGQVTTDFHHGGHNWQSWQRDLHAAFPMLLAALG